MIETPFWTLFLILVAAGVLSAVAILPYSLALNPTALDQLRAGLDEKGKRTPPMLVIALASTVQAGVLIAIATGLGLLAARAVGLRLPVLEAALAGRPALPILVSGLPVAALVGFGAGALIAVLERFVFSPRLPAAFRQADAKQPLWKRVLACFYGGIYEELLLRLFVMAGVIWLLGRAWPFAPGQIPPGIFWTANIFAALLFGAGHLPATARLAPLTPFIVTRALVLNGLAGVLFGVLFWHYGLELAMIAHFCADIVIHVLLPELKS